MHYRPLGNTGVDVSVLALGCMGFVDDDSAGETVQAALACGINYFETCWGYTDSERRLGEGLGQRRGEVMVSTKSYAERDGRLSVADTMRKRLEEQLRRLNTDYIDFYHAWHTTTEEDYANAVGKDGWLTAARKARDEGLIRHIGITTHAGPELVERMIDDGCWEVLTVQYSLLVSGYRPAVARAHEKGMGVIAIGGMGGGMLATPAPLLREVFGTDDQVSAALRYVLSDPGVSTMAVGMVWADEVRANSAAIDAMVDGLSADYQRQVDERLAVVLDRPEMAELKELWCDGCSRCIAVCNKLVEPWSLLRGYNGMMLGGGPRGLAGFVGSCQRVLDRCPECGRCAGICPRGIDIPGHLERVRDLAQSLADKKT
ncbi:MAG: aldo/keto reductase [Planctomycetota bacterium]|jgi:predicted aldo/keto reductase-like oxidoreductase